MNKYMLKSLLKVLNGMLVEAELVMSASLFSLLGKMKHPIAKIILDIHTDKIDIGDNSYVDIHPEKLGDITMLSHRRLERIPHDEIWSSRSRVDSGVGKLIRALIKKHGYKEDSRGILKKDGSTDISGRDIELFVSEFKALQQGSTEGESNFKIVSGEDIRHWYHEDNYMDNNGTLGSSCMRYDDTQEFLDMYCEESKVRMLIYTDLNDEGEEMLLGRALVWEGVHIKDSNEVITFMDRIYYNETHLEEVFKKYAQEQNWWYKVQQSYVNRKGITNGTDIRDVNMHVRLEENYYDKATPYVDTFAFIEKSTGTISNYNPTGKSKSMTDTDGNFGNECDYCEGEGQYDCDSCDGGILTCNRCDEGSVECEECDGNYESVRCSSCRATGKCSRCDGTTKYMCRMCDGTATNMRSVAKIVATVGRMLRGVYIDDRLEESEIKSVLDNLYHGLLYHGVHVYHIRTLEILEPYGITEDNLQSYGIGKCWYCEDGKMKCSCENGVCTDCEGNKTCICEYCTEGIAICGICEGEGVANCDDCNARGFIYCDYC